MIIPKVTLALGFLLEHTLEEKMEPEKIFIDEKAVSNITGFALPTLRNWRCIGKGPDYSKIGRAIRYKKKDVLAFMDAHRIEPRNKAA